MITPPPMQVASLGMWDSLILMGMALVVFGPRRLPEIARQIGKLMYEVRKASNDFKFQMEEELRRAEVADLNRNQPAPQPAPAQPALTAGKVETVETNEAPIIEAANVDPAKIQAPGAPAAVAELPGHAEINRMFQAVGDWPATPVSTPLPVEASTLAGPAPSSATSPNTTSPNETSLNQTSPHQEQPRHG